MAINNAAGAIPGAPLNFDRLDELIDSVNAYGGSKVLVMSKAMRRQLNALARASIGGGVYQTSTNSYGMTVHRYQVSADNEVGRSATSSLAGWVSAGHPGADAQGPGDAGTTDQPPTQALHGQTTRRQQPGGCGGSGGHLGAQCPPD
jgi:hypothetical protein